MKSALLMKGKIFGVESWKLRLMWLPALIVGLMVISWILVISPRIEEMTVYRKEAASSKKMAEELNQKQGYLESASDEDIQKQEQLLSQALLGSKNLYFMMSVMQNIATTNEFEVDSFSVSPGEVPSKGEVKYEVNMDSLSKVPLKVILLGPKEKYLLLIESIEKALPLLSIDDFKMNSSGSQVKMELTVATYFALDTSLNVKVKNLKLADLTLSKDELVTMEKLAGFIKLESNVGGGDTQGKNFVKYERSNPFSL